MAERRRQELLSKLAAARKRLAELEDGQRLLRQTVKGLQVELAGIDVSHPVTRPNADSEMPILEKTSEKIALFRSLFRGRPDVFAKRWVNPKKGTTGYAPACGNEWVRGVCEKPRVRCGECPNQAFLPITDRVILDHLRGRHVTGVYPLLRDETCWFLAADFDKGSWQKDVTAFLETCRRRDVPATVERSRSGDGAHVWFFFRTPVAAGIARNMACSLITEAMSLRHELSMDSYDRLFPNQDTMPRGGFGNLIALPFQDGPRQEGNTVFVDDQWTPYEDQWHHLATIRRLQSHEVESLARDAFTRGLVIGVRSGDTNDDDASQKPWQQKLSESKPKLAISEPLPHRVRATLAQLLFVEKAGLPSMLLNHIKRLAAFQNPEFYKKQALRLSTALTPRVVSCCEDHPQHIGLPRGCADDLAELLSAHDVALQIEDARSQGEPIEVVFRGELIPAQDAAAHSLIMHDAGVFVAPPGSGKTVVGAWLVAQRARSALVLVHRTLLLEQWTAQLAVFSDLQPKQIGQLDGGRRKLKGVVDVAMIQSLARGNDLDELVGGYGHVIVDECHHVPAVSFERVMKAVRAKYITGLTATPRRRDGHHPILGFQIGPVRYTIDPKSLAGTHGFEHRLIVRETAFTLDADSAESGIQEIYTQIGADEDRNTLILDDVIGALEEGRSPILLTERRDHLESLAERLRGFVRNLIVLRGGMGKKQRRDAADQLAAVPEDEERLIIATGRFIGEGFDDVRLDTLFLTMPVAWKGTLVQYAGRLHRRHGSKREVRIVDYVDRHVPVLGRMFEKRMRGYRAMGYGVDS